MRVHVETKPPGRGCDFEGLLNCQTKELSKSLRALPLENAAARQTEEMILPRSPRLVFESRCPPASTESQLPNHRAADSFG